MKSCLRRIQLISSVLPAPQSKAQETLKECNRTWPPTRQNVLAKTNKQKSMGCLKKQEQCYCCLERNHSGIVFAVTKQPAEAAERRGEVFFGLELEKVSPTMVGKAPLVNLWPWEHEEATYNSSAALGKSLWNRKCVELQPSS